MVNVDDKLNDPEEKEKIVQDPKLVKLKDNLPIVCGGLSQLYLPETKKLLKLVTLIIYFILYLPQIQD